DAERDGDLIYCVSRDVLSGYDGNEAKTNFIVPSAVGQGRLLANIYLRNNFDTRKILFVEAHGTDTPVGDPIEANCLGRFFNRSNLDPPLLLDLIKSNSGHTEDAAGVASLIKAAMCIYHRGITANMQFTSLNSKIDAQKYNLHIVQNFVSFPSVSNNEKIAIDVNSFGMGSTTTHAIIEEYQPKHQLKMIISMKIILKANNILFLFFQAFLQRISQQLLKRTISYTHSAIFVFLNRQQLQEQINAFLTEQTSPGLSIVSRPTKPLAQKICFVFSGQGPQWWAMGRQLYEGESIFNKWINLIDGEMTKINNEETVRMLAVSMSEEEVENKLLKDIEHLQKSIRECYELTNQQQSSPLILPTLKRKENEQITLLTSLTQLTTSSHVWQQYFHTRQISPMKNHEESFDNFLLYTLHLSPCWYESKDPTIPRLANRISTHPSPGIHQLNEQTSATWKSLININLAQHAFLKDHKIQDAILFPAVVYLELATAACHQLLSSKEDDQQQPTIIFEYINFIKALILNEHKLVEVFIQIIMPMRQWYIIFCKIEIDYKQQKSLTIPDRWTIQDITHAYQYGSSFQKIKTLRALVPGIETTFLPVRIQKFIYSSKTKTKTNPSANVEVHGKCHDNICGIGQEGTYSFDVRISPMDNKIEEPLFTFEGAVIKQVQGAHSGRWSVEQTIYDKLNILTDLPNTDYKIYLDTIIKDYCMKRVWTDSPIIKDISYLLPSPKSILNNEVNSISNQDLIESIEPFNELAAYYAQMAIKDLDLNQQHHRLLNAYILSGEKNGLDIFVEDDEIEQTFQQVKSLTSATKTQQIFHSICQHLQLQYEQQQTKDNSFQNYRLRIFWLTDRGLLIDLHYADSDPIQLANAQQTCNTHITNQIIDLYDIHVPLYFDLIFGFNDQWWSSSDDNNRALINIQQWTTLVEQIEGSNIIESTLNQNENDNNSFGDILSSLLPCSNIRIFDIRYSTLDIICFGISVLLTTYKQVSIIFVWQLDQVLLNENNDDLAFKQNEELICGTLSLILQTIQKSSPYFHPFVYVLTDHAQFNNDSNLNIIAIPFIGLARSLITEYERN
ncbi:unnamed protein product, partial [Adineta steineri]